MEKIMQELEELWQKVLLKMQNLVSAITFDLWISKLEPIELKNNETLMLFAHSVSAKNQILKNNSKHLAECVHDIFGDYVTFEILDKDEKEKYLAENKNNKTISDTINYADKHQFNEKYTFVNFVVGKSNQFCYAAAHAVAESPGKSLILYLYTVV